MMKGKLYVIIRRVWIPPDKQISDECNWKRNEFMDLVRLTKDPTDPIYDGLGTLLISLQEDESWNTLQFGVENLSMDKNE